MIQLDSYATLVAATGRSLVALTPDLGADHPALGRDLSG